MTVTMLCLIVLFHCVVPTLLDLTQVFSAFYLFQFQGKFGPLQLHTSNFHYLLACGSKQAQQGLSPDTSLACMFGRERENYTMHWKIAMTYDLLNYWSREHQYTRLINAVLVSNICYARLTLHDLMLSVCVYTWLAVTVTGFHQKPLLVN